MPAGYSSTPLLKKLGIKAGMMMHQRFAPVSYNESLGQLPEAAQWTEQAEAGQCDFVHAFYQRETDFIQDLAELKELLKMDGILWLSWPKKSAKMETDLNREIIREKGLAIGLVDVKVCAVDEKWSGLKFVYRLKDRPKATKRKG
ncbi:MAG: DUF3052 family protein [Bacteroidota bacterium]